MPTGYTHLVQQGKLTFNQFVWKCARAFGALIEMREEPMDAPIPEAIPASNYHAKALEKAFAERAEFETMGYELRRAAYEASEIQREDNTRRSRAERAEQLANYQAMASQVEAWTPPTAHHHELKRFMLDQLRESMRFDCGEWPAATPMSFDEWLAERKRKLDLAVEYHTEGRDKEASRNKERNEWLKALRESVPYEGPVTK